MKRIVILVCVAILAMQAFSDYTLSAQIITYKNIIKTKDFSKEVTNEQFDNSTKKIRYGQFIDVSYSRGYNNNYITGPNYITKSSKKATNTVSINYIGGCLIKERFFLGLGTGADVYLHQEVPQELSDYSSYNSSLISIPVFLHFRAEFMKTKCSPYIALSGGCSFTTDEAASQIHRQNEDYTYYYRLFGDATLGVNLRISKKIALYLGAGYKIEAIPYIGLWHGFSTRFGVKF